MTSNIDALKLITGIDIPVRELGVTLHQPTLREIAIIGEKEFYAAAHAFVLKTEGLNTENFTEEDKKAISALSNFELFTTTMQSSPELSMHLNMLFALLFPNYTITIEERFLMLLPQGGDAKTSIIIQMEKFDLLQDYVSTILCLRPGNNEAEYKPMGDKAKEIAEKLKRGREKVAKEKGLDRNLGSLLSKYISGLGIGTYSLNILDACNLTLYQFFNQIERYGLKESHNFEIQARMAGAKDVEEIDWLKNIDKI